MAHTRFPDAFSLNRRLGRWFGEWERFVEFHVEQDYRDRWPVASFHCNFSRASQNVRGEWAEPALFMFAEMFGPLYAALRATDAPREEVANLIHTTGRRLLERCYLAAQRRYQMEGYRAGAPAGMVNLRARTYEEERARFEYERALWARAQQVFQQEKFAPGAEEKAEETMLRYLTEEQAKEWREHKHFTVKLSERTHPKRHGSYRITRARSFNCEHLETGTKYCVVPDTRLPICDQMLATKLMLEGETEKFFQTANKMETRAAGWGTNMLVGIGDIPMYRVRP